uniref:Matrix-remodeling-associated protein 5-like n=1 Tax=Takifugu rubripes TaxID=31033 RepID=H2UAI5_TAKRU
IQSSLQSSPVPLPECRYTHAHPHSSPVCVPVALMSCLVLLWPIDIQACPRSCNCYQTSEVHCTFRSLLTIPPGLPLHTQRINFGFNSITTIHNRSLAGLKKLELLMLHSNNLHYLPDAVFADLKSLQILKLSYNKLLEIPSSLTFSGLTSLLRLYLDHNLLQHIHPRALLQLPSLRLLRLQGNRLHQLHPHALCTLSLLNTYYFSTLRHLDLSNNSLTTLPRNSLATAPLLETLQLQDNPWSCDCRMNWLLTWILAHPGLMKCPGGPQCPICASPNSLKSQALLEQTELTCILPVIHSLGREIPLEAEISEIDSTESFIQPLGSAFLELSDHLGNNIDLRCNITQPSQIQDNSLPEFSMASPTPLPLAVSLMLDCPVHRQGYEKLWRILAYYSETAVRLEREIMLSKAPSLAYRYRQTAETDGYYHSGVRASVKARPQWLLQPAISIQLNRANSNGQKVQLIYSTRVLARLDLTSSSTSSPFSQPWILISTKNTSTAFTAAAGHKTELLCPLLSSGNPKVHWILPDGSQHVPTYNSSNSRLQISASSLVLHKVQLLDAGIYYCVARTGRDVDVLPLRLSVEETSVPSSGEPIGLSVTSGVGEPVILTCKASGSPEPQTSWLLPDGNIVHQGVAATGGVTLYPNGSLLLPKPSRRDAGYYRCIAVNQYGSDALTTQLEVNSKHPPLLKMPFLRRPQSASGRSTKIRAPLLHEVGEGSGDENVEDQSLSGKKRQPRPPNSFPNRRYPGGNPQRHGTMRGPIRRGPLSSTDQRRNHVQNRFRVTTKKQRIDPQKWADLLAKIRQKTEHTSNNQTNRAENPKTKEVTSNNGKGHNDTESDGGAETVMESEIEGSSADVSDLQEEGLQPIYPIFTETKTHSEVKTDAGIDSEIKNGVVMSTAMQTDVENSSEMKIQTENVGPQTPIVRNADSQKEDKSVTISGTNRTLNKPVEGGERSSDSTIGPHKKRQRLLPNRVPNSQPQIPWNSRRRIGQRRRIMHRPGLRPLTPPQLHPRLSNTKSPTETAERSTEQPNLLLPSKTPSPVSLFTQNIYSRNAVEQNSWTPSVSYTVSLSTPKSVPPLVTSSPSSLTSVSPTHADRVTLRTEILEPTDFPQKPTRFDNTTEMTDVSDTSAKIHTYGIQTDTETQTVSGTHREKLERNSLNVPFVSHSSTLSSTFPTSISLSAVPIPSTTMAATEKITTSATTQNTPLSSTSITEMLWTTTSAPVTSHSDLSIITVPKQAIYSTTRMTMTTLPTVPSLSSTTVSPSTPAMTTTAAPTYRTFTSHTPATTSSAATAAPPFRTITSTTASYPTTVPTSIKTESAFFTMSNSSRSASVTITMATPTSAPSTSITTVIKTSSGVRTNVDRGRKPVSGGSTQSRLSTNWKNPGANSIPDSHSSRPRWPPSPPLPAAPRVSHSSIQMCYNISHLNYCYFQGRYCWKILQSGTVYILFFSVLIISKFFTQVPVLRSRPKIAEPHVRTVSFPAESTARLVCESEGEPKPFITWTKVATGAMMSIHSKAQRFEVLSNGTLVIHAVQLQDRGTYICSAHSFLGRDRSITTLDVWTRPPRMLVPSYRETTIHQGGELHLECRAEGVPTPLHSWVLPDRSVLTSTASSNSRITLDTNATLHISAILSRDRGLYRCVASNSAGAASATVHVYVSSLPPVMLLPREEHLLLSPGMPVYAHCSARGAPPPTLRWQIPNGTHVRPSQFLHDNLFVLPNGTLHIRKVGPKDSGNYECTASNAVATVLRPLPVSPFTKARIVSTSPSLTTVHYGRDLHLRCSVTGTPPPIVIWRTPSKKLVDMNFSFDRRLKVHSNGTLSVQAVTEKDAGDYLCITRNKVADDYRLLRVSVTTKPAKIERRQPLNHMVSLGKTLKVDCQASGLPDPIVHWKLPDGTMVNNVLQAQGQGGRAQKLTVFDNGTLLVPAIGAREEGEYTCYAQNQGGQDTMKVKVKVKVMMATPPTFSDDKNFNIVKVPQGNTAVIQCQAKGDPIPIITWFSPAHVAIPHRSRLYRERIAVLLDGSLEVHQARELDTGNYTCRASNSAGETNMVNKPQITNSTELTVSEVTLKKQALKGQSVLLPCPSEDSPPPRLAWILPSNGVLPAPYYGSRFTVYRNGSLELRSVRVSDSGTLTCVVRGTRHETKILVELEVSEFQEEIRSSQSGAGGGTHGPEGYSLSQSPQSTSRLVSPEKLHLKVPITQTPLKTESNSAPFPLPPPPHSIVPLTEPVVKSRTVPLVSITNGETLQLFCPLAQIQGYTQGSLSWTLPNGKILSLGESGDSGRYHVQENGTLTVLHTTVFDRGTYTCKYMSSNSLVSSITVPVIIIAYPPRITMGPSPLTYTRAGVTVELQCLTIATPRATITWETPDLTRMRVMGQAHLHGNRYLSPHGSLVIQNPTRRDSGVYKCTASNVIGVDTKMTYLHVL